MVSLTATIFKAVINDSGLAAATAEYIIDLAISEINNIAQADLPMMGGTGGSKTVSLESKEYGAVMKSARAIYWGCYKKNQKGIGTPGLNITPPTAADIQSNPAVQEAIEKAARQLAEFDVDYG